MAPIQAYAAQYRGRHAEAKRLFDAAEGLPLPAGTYRVLQTARAPLTFEHGDPTEACRILRDNIEVLLDSDYTDVTRMFAVEFIPMMTSLDRPGDAAKVLPYLDTTADFASMARTHLMAEPIRRLETDPTLTRPPRRRPRCESGRCTCATYSRTPSPESGSDRRGSGRSSSGRERLLCLVP